MLFWYFRLKRYCFVQRHTVCGTSVCVCVFIRSLYRITAEIVVGTLTSDRPATFSSTLFSRPDHGDNANTLVVFFIPFVQCVWSIQRDCFETTSNSLFESCISFCWTSVVYSTPIMRNTAKPLILFSLLRTSLLQLVPAFEIEFLPVHIG